MTDPMQPGDLKPCPFCQSSNVTGPGCRPGRDKEAIGAKQWQVWCLGCGAFGPRLGEAEAIAAWNTRAAPALPPVDVEAPLDAAITGLITVHRKMLQAVKRQRPYPVSIALGDDDTFAVLNGAIELERAKSQAAECARLRALVEAALDELRLAGGDVEIVSPIAKRVWRTLSILEGREAPSAPAPQSGDG